jgi:hypothetical protein
VVAKVRKRLAVSKGVAQEIDMERFNLKNLNEGNVKEQYQVTIRNKFAALENFEDSGDINKAWNNMKENIRILAQESVVVVNQSIVNCGLMRSVQNWLIEGSRLNYRGYRPKVKGMKMTCVIYEGKLVDISGTRKGNI